MVLSAGKLVKCWRKHAKQHPGEERLALLAYEAELATLLGMTLNDDGYRTIADPVLRPKQASIRDIAEAFIGTDELRALKDRTFGMVGGHARTVAPPAWRLEEVGGGALGPSQFAGLNAWFATVDGLLGAEVLERYTLGVSIAREVAEWKNDVRVQENKQFRLGGVTGVMEDIQPAQELPSGDMGADWIRNNRMRKQGVALPVTWEAAWFDQTDTLVQAADDIADGLVINVNNRVERALWGIDNTYNRQGTLGNTYRTTGAYVNQIDNDLVDITSLDKAEQVLMAQVDPITGRLVDSPAASRQMVVSMARRQIGQWLGSAAGMQVGTLNASTRFNVAAGPAFYKTFSVAPSVYGVSLMVKALGITPDQAARRWVWGDVKGAFQYRSAKDITTYRYTITEAATLARRDVLMELDCTEMGSVTIKDPRKVVLNTKDVITLMEAQAAAQRQRDQQLLMEGQRALLGYQGARVGAG